MLSGKIVAFMAVLAIAISVSACDSLYNKPAKQSIHDDLKNKVLVRYPELTPEYTKAMSDGVLTLGEVKGITDMAIKIKEEKSGN